MSSAPATNPYLRTKIMTASPEELRLMLYDGAIRFCRQAQTALTQQKIEDGYNALMRAQKIVLELSSSLDHQADPELCGRLSALYTYIYRRLVDANVSRDSAAIHEAIELIEYERQTWQMLMQKLAAEGTGRAGRVAAPAYPTAGAAAGAVGSLSQSA